IQAQRQEAFAAPLGWSVLYLPLSGGENPALLGENPALFQAVYFGSIAVFLLFAIGVATRLTGILTWVAVLSFLANPATNYEGDYLLGILAFYLMIAYLLLGQWNGNLTTIERILGSRDDFLFAGMIWKREERPASFAANFAIRLVQVHF